MPAYRITKVHVGDEEASLWSQNEGRGESTRIPLRELRLFQRHFQVGSPEELVGKEIETRCLEWRFAVDEILRPLRQEKYAVASASQLSELIAICLSLGISSLAREVDHDSISEALNLHFSSPESMDAWFAHIAERVGAFSEGKVQLVRRELPERVRPGTALAFFAKREGTSAEKHYLIRAYAPIIWDI